MSHELSPESSTGIIGGSDAPTPEAGQLFMASFNATIKDYSDALHEKEQTGELQIQNDNFDTGTGPGEYPLADATYAELVAGWDNAKLGLCGQNTNPTF